MNAAIEIRGVRKTFGPKVAVHHLDMTIPMGSVSAFLGPNGAGKTTTIRMIMSILFADQGEIRVLGKPSAIESKDRIGYLPEERGTYRKMKVGAFLTYMARLKGIDTAGLDAKVKRWLDRVSLADCYRKKCMELSKGMQQKVQFLSSIIHEPDLIILDEPFSGLDPVNARMLRELIQEQHDQGRTIIFSTHVMTHAEQLCDHIFMINRGHKVLDESMESIRSRFEPSTVIVEPVEGQRGVDQLRDLQGLREIEHVGGVWELRFNEGTNLYDVMREVISAVQVRRMELKRTSLEDVFIKLVGASGGVGREDLVEDAAALIGTVATLERGAAR